MPALILDCSVTLSLAFEDEFDAYSVRVFESVRRHGALVPRLWSLEVANILSISVRRGRLTEERAFRFLSLLSEQPIEAAQLDGEKAVPDAMKLFSLSRRHSLTAYDAAYLQLALASGLPLASKDRELNDAAKSAGIRLFA